ncbi:MAG: choice-of-anchor E domain-containing protein [Verrucomicrobia bacterium]|nr:choice-of-anchor E domain-containing protein [Kiritimatiellia bacterium]MCP5488754.1 choice-of-anchor E domain-containing protein [Verrucomicrobiota bacterium]
MKPISVLLCIVMSVCVATAPSLRAAIFEQTEVFSGIPNLEEDLEFQQWNPDWGTLNSIFIQLSLTANGGAYQVDNDSGTGSSSDVSFGANGNLSSSDVWLFNGANATIFNSDIIAATTANITLTGNDGDAEVGGTGNFSLQGTDYGQVIGGEVTSSGSDFVGALWYDFGGRSYLGSGTFTLTASIDQYTTLGSISGVQQLITPLDVEGFVRVTYDYDGPGPFGPAPVPEPTTLILFVLGAAASYRRVRVGPDRFQFRP